MKRNSNGSNKGAIQPEVLSIQSSIAMLTDSLISEVKAQVDSSLARYAAELTLEVRSLRAENAKLKKALNGRAR